MTEPAKKRVRLSKEELAKRSLGECIKLIGNMTIATPNIDAWTEARKRLVEIMQFVDCIGHESDTHRILDAAPPMVAEGTLLGEESNEASQLPF